MAHSGRTLSVQPYTVTYENALSGSEDSRPTPTWDKPLRSRTPIRVRGCEREQKREV